MFGMGVGELLLIFIIALVIFGPEKLPSIAKTLGKAIREFKSTTDELSQTIQKEINIADLKHTLDLPAEVKQSMSDIVLPPDEVKRRRKEKLDARKQADTTPAPEQSPDQTEPEQDVKTNE